MIYFLLFISGMLTFFAPCILPLVPLYLSYLTGTKSNKKKSISNAIAFCCGFTLIFVAVGVIFSTVYIALGSKIVYLHYFLGIIIILFGLNFLGVNIIKIPSINKKNLEVDITNINFFKSFLFGVVFALSFSPCLNAYLGTALALASSTNTTDAIVGGVQILFFALGLSVPFLLSAILIEHMKNTMTFMKKHMNIINKISGLFMIFMGILIFFGLHNKIAMFLY